MPRFSLRAKSANAETRRVSHLVSLAFAAAIASGHTLVGCGESEKTSPEGSGGAEAGQGGGERGGSGGTVESGGSAPRGGASGDAGEGGSADQGGSGGGSGSSASGGATTGGSGDGGQTDDGGAGGDGGSDLSACRTCMAENPEIGPVQAEYCDVSE